MARHVAGNRVAANLIVAINGGTMINSSSGGLSFPEDRQRFHQLRQEFDAILIGGNTARNEPYKKTPIPLIVLSHHDLPKNIAANNPLAVRWNLPIAEALPKAVAEFGDVLIEAGPQLIKEALAQGLVTELFLTISNAVSNENPIDIANLTQGAEEIARESSAGGLFLRYRLAPSHH